MKTIKSVIVTKDNIGKVAHLDGPGGKICRQWENRTGEPMKGFYFEDSVHKPCPRCGH